MTEYLKVDSEGKKYTSEFKKFVGRAIRTFNKSLKSGQKYCNGIIKKMVWRWSKW